MFQASVLIVVDDSIALSFLRSTLERQSHVVVSASSGHDAIDQIQSGMCPDLVFLDFMAPTQALEVLRRLHCILPLLRVVLISSADDLSTVVEAMRLGACDYAVKPVDASAVELLLKRNLPERTRVPASEEEGACEDQVEELSDGNCFAAISPAMQKVRTHIHQIATVDVPVLLLGESGTGKEIAAMLIHKLSRRSRRNFVKVNCAAIPADLLESELFGFEAGAFTGAAHARPGKFELADHGTILLDEIAEMPPGLQAKLLQVAQDHRFFRLGARTPISVDVRILAATNVNIGEAIKAGKLRLDLYYRLNTFSIQIPPLRHRREEIPALMRLFMRRIAPRYGRPARPFSDAFISACMNHFWAGNLRELYNVVTRHVILGDESVIITELTNKQKDFPLHFHRPEGRDLKEIVRTLKGEAEAEVIKTALEQTNWKRREAAELLNISYKALVYKARQYGIEGRKPVRSFPVRETRAMA